MKNIRTLLFTIFILACQITVYNAQTGKINFSVKNSITGIGEKAKIIITNSENNKKIETNEYGFSEQELPIGNYDITISSKGYITQNSHYNIEAFKNLNIIVSLDPEIYPTLKIIKGKAIISGFITDAKTNLALVNATIEATTQNIKTKTDEKGYFELLSPIYTQKNAEINDIKRISIKISKAGYGFLIYNDLPLYEDNLILKLSLKKGAGNDLLNYKHKLTEKNDERDEIVESNPQINTEGNDFKLSTNSCSPPSVIRLFRGANNGPCTSCLGCTEIEQMSLEQYVRTGLDDEWIAYWQDQSLLAGAVAYRTYGAWNVLHPYGTNYDIVAYPCRQHWDGNTSYAFTINATNSTVNEVLLNSSNAIAFSEYAAETNNFGCGDCFSGQGTWPCISDNVCCGKTPAGHGRGMCQWGSHRWAQQSQTYTWILDHYYNPGGYFRCTNLPGSFSLTLTPECNGTTSQIRLNWTASANAATYDVYRNGTLYLSGITGTQFINTAVTTGTSYTYYVKAINTAGETNNSNGTLSATAPNCSGSLSCAEAIVIDTNNPFDIKVFPNPSSGEYFLTATNILNKEISIEILNILGQQLYYTKKKALSNNFNQTLNIKNSATGVYLMKITIDKNSYTKQLIKQ
mgnify:CR=1 FL=1